MCLLGLSWVAEAQKMTSYQSEKAGGYAYWVCTPSGYVNGRADKPVIVFLHGASSCGTDLSKVLRYGPLDAVSSGLQVDAVLVAPQNPGGAWSPSKIMDVLRAVERRFSVDTNRRYVLGMSLGGYGTVDFVGTYPDRIAAGMALCGGGSLRNYCGLAKVPFWILHGTDDRAVAVSESQAVVAAMAACGDTSRLRCDWLPGVNHGQLGKAFYVQETYQWLLSHSLLDAGRPVNRVATLPTESFSSLALLADRKQEPSANSQSQNSQGKETSPAAQSKPQAKPSTPTTAKPASSPQYYTVRKGDTLTAIARKYHTSVAKLCKLNKIKENAVLQIGRKLRVK